MSEDYQPYEYLPVSDLAQKVKYLFIIQIIITCIAIWSGWLELNLLNNAKEGLIELTRPIRDANDQRQLLVWIFQVSILVISLILFLVWLNRLSQNTRIMSEKTLRFSLSLTVAYFFIPIVSWFRPYQATKELWAINTNNAKNSLLSLWWAFWLISSISGFIAFRLLMRAKEMDSIITASQVTLLSDIFEIPSSILVIALVQKLTNYHNTFRETFDSRKLVK